MRFIHTADWQIGKPFKQFGDRESVLRQARLVAIENIGQLAAKEGAAHVLVAGDVYDTEAPTPRTLLEPVERMRRFSDVQWHLLPGNHDPHRPKGCLGSGPGEWPASQRSPASQARAGRFRSRRHAPSGAADTEDRGCRPH